MSQGVRCSLALAFLIGAALPLAARAAVHHVIDIESGQIAGIGFLQDGHSHGSLATPVPESGALVPAWVTLAWLARRRRREAR